MQDDSLAAPHARTRFFPYIFGTVTGVAVAVAVMSVVVMKRNLPGPAPGPVSTNSAPSTYQTASATGEASKPDTKPTVDPITDDRRNAIVRATAQVAPAVISINAYYTVHTRPVYDLWFNRWYPSRAIPQAVLGSGIIIDKHGYAFTNFHVVKQAERIQVTTSKGETYNAKLVGTAPSYDLALLKIDGDNFDTAPLGNSDELLVGEWAIAIGSPFGFQLADVQPTVTVGVISALHRDIKQDPESEQIFNDMIQTDAAINPGNSGGPLVNAHGEVIGINTLIFTGGQGTDTNIGLGFAIPINRARFVMDEIREHGHVRNVWLGLTAEDITPEVQSALDLPSSTGVVVKGIEDGGPAALAGLKPGDQIMAINGVSVRSREEANRVIFGSAVGQTIEITVNRKDKLMKFKVTLAERPGGI
ncbi:MAG TPA: trypsin-like peptidase domain-containing protein [Candidatus Krumholzibacteria bacterium]|nr:trypsin-like peptidase domain-containing protein [Candidatus Krumholzibacteria bacterium]